MPPPYATPVFDMYMKAARSIIPGKNPKTQRDVQSGRLCLSDRPQLALLSTGVKANATEAINFNAAVQGNISREIKYSQKRLLFS